MLKWILAKFGYSKEKDLHINTRAEFDFYNPDIKLLSIERHHKENATVISFYFKDKSILADDGGTVFEWFFRTNDETHDRLCEEFNKASEKRK